MTRRDYGLIAEVFKLDIKFYGEATGYNDPDEMAPINIVKSTAKMMADTLAQDNKAFDIDKFIKNCGIQ